MVKSPPLDPAHVPPGIDPGQWALYVRRELRQRYIVRCLVALLVLAPLSWVGWRFAHPAPSAPQHYARAEQLFARGNARAALAAIKQSLHEAPEVGRARHLAGRIQLQMGAYPEAVKEFRKARDLGFEEHALDAALGAALLRQSEASALLAMLDTSALRTANPGEWYALRAAAERLLGQPAAAEHDYSAALARDSGNARALRGLARLDFDAGRQVEALAKAGRAVDADRREVDSWLLKGEFELAAGTPALAEEAFHKAVDLNPFRREARAGLAQALLAMDEIAAAAREIESLAGVAPHDPMTLHLRGELACRRGDETAAIEAWQQALKADPDHGPAQRALGSLFESRGQHEQALDLLGRYVTHHRGDVEAVRTYARVALALDAPVRALEALITIADATLTDPELVALLGRAYLDSPPNTGTSYVRQLAASREHAP